MILKKNTVIFASYMLTLCCWITGLSFSEENELDANDLKKAKTALMGLDDVMMRINNGICLIKGETLVGERKMTDSIFIAFDYQNNKYLYENEGIGKFLLTPNYFYEIIVPHWLEVGENKEFLEETSVWRSNSSDYELPLFDSVIIDIQDLFCLVPHGPHKPFDYQNSDFHKNITNPPICGYEEFSSDLIKVTTKIPYHESDFIFTEYYINPKHNYTITHLESYTQSSKVSDEDGHGGDKDHYFHDVTWEKINDTWVPIAYSFRSNTDYLMSINWKIEWNCVNTHIDSNVFTIENAVSENTMVPLWSKELGQEPVMIGYVENLTYSPIHEKQTEKMLVVRGVLVLFGMSFIAAGLWNRFRSREQGIGSSKS